MRMRMGRARSAQASLAAAAGPCPSCAADDWRATRPGWLAGLGQWLTRGGPWRPVHVVCGRCGSSSGQQTRWYTSRPRRWWTAPVRVPWTLWQAVRWQRTAIPSPAVYLGAAAIGSLLGVLAQRLVGWPWWVLGGMAVVAVWVVFAATALTRSGDRSEVAAAVLGVFSPERALARRERREAEQVRAAPFPLYGLPPAWPGLRHLAGVGWSHTRGQRQPVVTEVGLGHGSPLAEEPTLTVTVQPVASAPGQTRSKSRLAEQLWAAAPPTSASPPAAPLPVEPPPAEADAFLAALADRQRRRKRRPAAVWQQRTLRVDGQPVAFDWLAEGSRWVAHGQLEELLVTLQARDFPVDAVELVRVTDVEPYIEGARQLRATVTHRGT